MEKTMALKVNITQFIITAPLIPPFAIRLTPRSKSVTAKEERSAAKTRTSPFFLATVIPVTAPEKNRDSIEKIPRYLPGDENIYAIGEKSAAHKA